VPLSTPVDEFKVTPFGSAPVSLKVIVVGSPVAVTVNDPSAPTMNVALLALVIVGAWFTVKVKFCVASDPMPLEAVKVMG
jgi:hypothetical protein